MKSIEIDNIDYAISYCERLVQDIVIDYNNINEILNNLHNYHIPQHAYFIKSYFVINKFMENSYTSRKEDLIFLKGSSFNNLETIEKFKDENNKIESSNLFKFLNSSTESLEIFIQKDFPESSENFDRQKIASDLNDTKRIINRLAQELDAAWFLNEYAKHHFPEMI